MGSTTKLPPLKRNEVLNKSVLHDKQRSRDYSQSELRDKNNTPSVLSEISEFEKERGKSNGKNLFISGSKS